jgi:hypothetical protein
MHTHEQEINLNNHCLDQARLVWLGNIASEKGMTMNHINRLLDNRNRINALYPAVFDNSNLVSLVQE